MTLLSLLEGTSSQENMRPLCECYLQPIFTIQSDSKHLRWIASISLFLIATLLCMMFLLLLLLLSFEFLRQYNAWQAARDSLYLISGWNSGIVVFCAPLGSHLPSENVWEFELQANLFNEHCSVFKYTILLHTERNELLASLVLDSLTLHLCATPVSKDQVIGKYFLKWNCQRRVVITLFQSLWMRCYQRLKSTMWY